MSAVSDVLDAHPLPHRRPHPALLLLLGLALIGGAAAVAWHLSEQQVRRDAQARLIAQRLSIGTVFDRLRHLPVAVVQHPDVRALAATPIGSTGFAALQTRVNTYLQTVAVAANASLLYVLDARGITLASSNWTSPQSLVGDSYSFRPYFLDAMKFGSARYFAVGLSTAEAGYYDSSAIGAEDNRIGVAVVKAELESLQAGWRASEEQLLLLDEFGVVILSSDPAWRFRTTHSVDLVQRAAFELQRKYAGNELLPLFGTDQDAIARKPGRKPQHDTDIGKSIVLDNQHYLVSRATLEGNNWQLLYLTPSRSIRQNAVLAGLATALLSVLSLLGFLYRQERRRRRLLAQASEEAWRMRTLNSQLEAEVSERRRAEQELRDAQRELIQASKLAALGQMSAAIAHEVNQPLSAIRMFSASARVLLERERIDEACHNLDEINELTERLATITSDLKIFARRSDDARDPVCIQSCLSRVATRLQPALQEQRVAIELAVPDAPLHVLGSDLRLEQVLSNLIRNAIDAAAEQRGIDEADDATNRQRRVKVGLVRQHDQAILQVQDTGAGIDPKVAEHLFDPFFTTKPVGQGVGLGLALAYSIVQEMRGELQASNAAQGGALFTLILQACTAESESDQEPDGLPA